MSKTFFAALRFGDSPGEFVLPFVDLLGLFQERLFAIGQFDFSFHDACVPDVQFVANTVEIGFALTQSRQFGLIFRLGCRGFQIEFGVPGVQSLLQLGRLSLQFRMPLVFEFGQAFGERGFLSVHRGLPGLFHRTL
ncbi:MAG: hypothetical protein ACE5EF_04935, partial [Dehalococcoidia bacterium]